MDCSRCKKTIINPVDRCSTGYGKDHDGNIICYDCCADIDREFMDTKGKIDLYLVESHGLPTEVINWPGTLRLKVTDFRRSRHNFGGFRTDVWFNDHTGKKWHGYQIGDFKTICYCKQLKTIKKRS